MAIAIRRVDADEATLLAGPLAELLVACVDGGASVSFLAPLARERAMAFWKNVAASVAASERLLLVAFADDGRVAGTVQVVTGQPENQPHRAEIAKMLVAPAFRRRGLGEALLRAAEDAARAAGKTLLVLDTATGGDAERLYARIGWTKVGTIPEYALLPHGEACATTIFYKRI